MNGRKFSWLPVLFISMLFQLLIGLILEYVELRIFPQSIMFIFSFSNILLIAIIGGYVANYYYIKNSLDIGGISAVLFIIINQLILGYEILNLRTAAIVLIVYFIGCFGAYLHHRYPIKRKT
ncbi:hypothetical protein [Sporosarcina beigongshangi]|uniref:hypothetical protein n=1 Tax=Sporosarcina beigongshangi TaxID=2782538 RepID=UPI00193961A3|nr:hypothetical protein [Sporosarcina beigongshangi]